MGVAELQDIRLPVGCFGKLPSRGDFVGGDGNHQLMQMLDRWTGQALEQMAGNPAWRQLYDQARPLHFAFLGSGSRVVIGGHFLPSRDASGRRFPFLIATRLEVLRPLSFIGRSPLALARPWSLMARLGQQALGADDTAAALREIAATRLSISAEPQAWDAAFADFLELQDLGTLQALLQGSGHPRLCLRRMLPALGLLMQPVAAAGGGVDKGLSLPLPADGLYRPLVAAFWLDLVSGFLARADFELVLLVREGGGLDGEGGPRLLVGLNGADGRTLHAALDPAEGAERFIAIDDADWVDEPLAADYGLNKLASHLDRGDLSLRTAREAFNRTFLGI
ncbi:type VI secretion system-associated protein TagF [Lysobacter sp. GX 14042]|uniref:type VI secretion system-associated protein TagF n=1 Tax=Lysobacter sp. GX 14042 TaxID=2907155 RepID=UPI001F20DE65|nr:type VI secretion system-associated protein TagF [Lysobacter sp. GX 14042]MCE7032156.1 type VI secretion system-associated protein TagF [Lysobacter sp. GX 14042]